jgi:hypothetical protein
MKKLSKTSPRFRGFLLAPLKKKKKKTQRAFAAPPKENKTKEILLKNFLNCSFSASKQTPTTTVSKTKKQQ